MDIPPQMQPGERDSISYAHQNRHSLPHNNAPSGLSNAPIGRDFYMAANPVTPPTVEEEREAAMVKRDKPKPVLKPSPVMAYGPDKAAFNDAWASNSRRVSRPYVPSTDIESIRARMVAARTQNQSHER